MSCQERALFEVLLGNPGFYHFAGFCFFLAVGVLRSSDRLKRSVNPHCRAGVHFPKLLGPQDTYFQNARHDSGSLAYRMKPKTRHLWATCAPVPVKLPSLGRLSQAYARTRAHTHPLHNNCSGLRGSPNTCLHVVVHAVLSSQKAYPSLYLEDVSPSLEIQRRCPSPLKVSRHPRQPCSPR